MTGHRYGPHNEATAVNAVVVLHQPTHRDRPVELVLPLPEALRRQFRNRNQLAHEQGRARD